MDRLEMEKQILHGLIHYNLHPLDVGISHGNVFENKNTRLCYETIAWMKAEGMDLSPEWLLENIPYDHGSMTFLRLRQVALDEGLFRPLEAVKMMVKEITQSKILEV